MPSQIPSQRRTGATFLALGLLVWPIAAQAQSEFAKVSDVRGQVTFERGTRSQPLTLGDALAIGDRLRTGPDGRARLSLGGGGGEIDLGPNSDLSLAEREPSRSRTRMKLWVGRLWSRVISGLGGADYAVETPNAVCGVRGTVFEVLVNKDGETEVSVSEGKVALANQGGRSVDVGPGQTARVDRDGRVQEGALGSQAPEERRGADLSDPQKAERARSMLTQMRENLSALTRLLGQATEEGDVVRLNCVQEKLFAFKGLLGIAESAAVNLEEAIARRDADTAQHEYEKVEIAAEKGAGLVGEGQSCVGESAVYSGETSVEVEIEPGSEPALDIVEIIDVPETRPPAASPYQ